jgi:patatin-related protein
MPVNQLVSSAGFKAEREIRYAVVMYGGVSLAIYMNGVALELLNMVRSTAESPGRDLQGTELVYRALAEALHPKPRFVVDVISGTSAGGINGIFLAKALCVNGEVSPLKQLWINEGEIAKLICDDQFPASLPAKNPPQSLLNTRRMYEQLYVALEGMDAAPGDHSKPLVNELDVFVTTTDLNGQNVELRLYDSVATEKKYRHRYHFSLTDPDRSGLECNDFRRDSNPFLAFAARCTSAFPFAFEPMETGEAKDLLRARGLYNAWARSVQEHLISPYSEDFDQRVFGDGAYLDNAPFSYATKGLAARHYSMPTDRKLVYVEPDPQRLTWTQPKHFNFVENTLACLISLPRYETIREDIEAIKERNHVLERLEKITRFIDEGVGGESPDNAGLIPNASGAETYMYLNLKPQQVAQTRGGAAYASYHNIKLASVTDDLVRLISNILGLGDETDTLSALKQLIKKWREAHYDKGVLSVSGDLHETSKAKGNENMFLLQFDINYRLRRLEFLMRVLDNAVCGDRRGLELFGDAVPGILRELRQKTGEVHKALRCVYGQLWRTQKQTPSLSDPIQVRQKIEDARQHLVSAFMTLQFGQETEIAADSNRLADAVSKWIRLPESEADAVMQQFLEGNNAANMQKLSEAFSGLLEPLKECFTWASDAMQKVLSGEDPVHKKARNIYRYYENYDAAGFPVLYATAAQNASITDIIRISPMDTCSSRPGYLEAMGSGGNGIAALPPAENKLGGVTLAHFSAFLQQEWRQNDIMWGRLNAVERLLSTCDKNARRLAATPIGVLKKQKACPDSFKVLEQFSINGLDSLSLLDVAHMRIIEEELSPQKRQSLYELIGRSLVSIAAADEKMRVLREMLSDTPNTTLEQQVQSVLQQCMQDEKGLLLFLREKYRCDVRPDSKRALRALARSAKVAGAMLEGLQKEKQLELPGYRSLLWIIRIFWGLVEIAIPRSVPQVIGRYWITLMYLVGGITIAGGLLLNNALGRWGAAVAAAAFVLDMARLALQRFIGGIRISPAKRLILDLAVAGLAGTAIWASRHWPGEIVGTINEAAASVREHRTLIGVAIAAVLLAWWIVWDVRNQIKKLITSKQKKGVGKENPKVAAQQPKPIA